jgi:hypothetical protein
MFIKPEQVKIGYGRRERREEKSTCPMRQVLFSVS